MGKIFYAFHDVIYSQLSHILQNIDRHEKNRHQYSDEYIRSRKLLPEEREIFEWNQRFSKEAWKNLGNKREKKKKGKSIPLIICLHADRRKEQTFGTKGHERMTVPTTTMMLGLSSLSLCLAKPSYGGTSKPTTSNISV